MSLYVGLYIIPIYIYIYTCMRMWCMHMIFFLQHMHIPTKLAFEKLDHMNLRRIYINTVGSRHASSYGPNFQTKKGKLFWDSFSFFFKHLNETGVDPNFHSSTFKKTKTKTKTKELTIKKLNRLGLSRWVLVKCLKKLGQGMLWHIENLIRPQL